MATYRLDLAYDGSYFHGFARQPDLRTVQGELERALAVLVGSVATVGAGRTDAGVHARAQVVSFDHGSELDTGRLVRSLQGMLGEDVAVKSCRTMPPGWNARFAARWRAYRYRLDNAPVADPLTRRFAWHVPDPLDLHLLNRAAAHFVGEHDFTSFCRSVEGKTNLRRVLEASWWVEESTVWFQIRAVSFCHQQVRSLVPFCVDAGRGRVDPDSLPGVLEARDRASSRGVAPPHGLILWDVGYE